MRRSKYFLPTLKEIPAEAQIQSHRLMLRAGMIRQTAAGIYSWLPLGLKVLRNIEKIVREEMNATGAQEIIMPTVQPSELWLQSGRYDDYGKEMLRIKDRHDRDLLYGPTHEEIITDIFRNNVKTYRDLPQNLYQIHWKFRDEVRPRYGVMRGREFYMKDNYSFDIDFESGLHSYNKMFVSYLRTFARMGLTPIPMLADSGAIGGNMSHEFIVLADTGESAVYCSKDWFDTNALSMNINFDTDLQEIVDDWTKLYAATDEKHKASACPLADSELFIGRGIEVGHIFYFGTKYSSAMGAFVSTPGGKEVAVQMGSYGIGVSRLVGAIIEANHDDLGIIWPDSVAPFQVGLINLRVGNYDCDQVCEKIYQKLSDGEIDTLYDDRDERAGIKFSEMDLLGIPLRFSVGPRGLQSGHIELKRRGGDVEELSVEEALKNIL